jgi:hypothetical protein
MCVEGGRRLNLLPSVKTGILTLHSSLQTVWEGGGACKEPEPGYEPESGIYFGQKGLVPTLAVHLLEQEDNYQ